MSINAHLNTLKEKHAYLSSQIQYAYNHHYADEKLSALKKKRLRIKQEMHFYSDVDRQSAA